MKCVDTEIRSNFFFFFSEESNEEKEKQDKKRNNKKKKMKKEKMAHGYHKQIPWSHWMVDGCHTRSILLMQKFKRFIIINLFDRLIGIGLL